MNSVKQVIFDSNSSDVEYVDRTIIWLWDGEVQLDSWNNGKRYTEFLTEDEFRVQFPITYCVRHLFEDGE